MMCKKLSILLLGFLIAAGACTSTQTYSSIEKGAQFMPETLGLVPGASAAELNFTWYADAGSGDVSQLRLFNEQGKLVKTVNGTANPASEGKVSHKVSVSGLNPHARYRYSVSNNGSDWSYDYNFRTAKQDSFSFACVGDPQLTLGEQDKTSNLFSADKTTAQGWKDTIVQIAKAGVDFIAGVGDQVDITAKGNENEYRNFFAPDELKTIPFAPAVGNHDRHYPFGYHFNLPNEQKFEPIVNAANKNDLETGTAEAAGNYWYLYNNTLFVVLNTSAYPDSAAAAEPYIDRFDTTLNAATAANRGKYTWLFVQHHKSTASIAQHIADEDIQYYVEAGFEKLMDKYNVDFVLAGHDHVYARSYAMRDGKPVNTDRDTIANPGAAIYLTVTTASGLKYYNIFDTEGIYVKNNTAYPYLVNGLTGSASYLQGNMPLSNSVGIQNKKPEYTVIQVSGKSVSFKTYDIDSGNPIDSFTVTK
ncbi:MAG: metallophosphoesterase family protein [Treponema sp.]|jgi:hypothetical protein|nr:metallophosphoesterase family protein [Treponema sp.]